MQTKRLAEITKLSSIEELATSLKQSGHAGQEAGINLVKTAAEFGLSVRDYITLAGSHLSDRKNSLNAYELLLAQLNLPVKNDFERGVFLQAAADTFQTHEGTRALFPEVIDDVVRFATRQDQLESVKPMLANSRTISGPELLSTVIEDTAEDRKTFMIPELANIPVRSIRTSEKSVKIYKHGSAIRTSYEFSRRASIDLFIPHANRIARELEISKVAVATGILINGDGAYGAATVVTQSSLNDAITGNATNGTLSYKHLIKWLVKRAAAGIPIDTIAMNWDGWFQWTMMFGTLATGSNWSLTDLASKAGVNMDQMPAGMSALRVTPVISSAVPANKLLGFSKGDTLEELVEAGSQISESERAIKNQSITFVRTENTGYRLVYGDTRSILDFGA